MQSSRFSASGPCVVEGVEPLLTELQDPISLCVLEAGDAGRQTSERFVQQVFQRSYGADITSFYPTLLSFSVRDALVGVAGFRAAGGNRLFSEQYLDQPLEQLISNFWNVPVDRNQIVEVGNLAMTSPGQARWVIAAVTVFLYSRGYRWVMFTAVNPLINAFRRLGLKPVVLASADPARLAEDGQRWGSYYAAKPSVCVGDIEAGYRKLVSSAPVRQPMLQVLLEQAQQQAALPMRKSLANCGAGR
ncbi:MAG: thermostable hemolysin [Gammaproteobacteria bacterium]|nr:thermostable hemolysin [Gammaproteobacteria bacterium]